MARRFSKEEKGKDQLKIHDGPHIIRIKAPCVDNSALIRDNELTLIGRTTNPQEQRMWALIPALPRKWHLQGRVSGSDLGNGCFQFRFEREEDLKRVLDNRPYHFAYWMVILQRWEPIISESFPSQIPFWIRVKGLPLHFWHEDMLCDIGKELGTLMNHELTKTSARIQVLVDGLKPLVKKSIVEYDSGEESFIYLEYERLEQHCSFCNAHSHLKKDCPNWRAEEPAKLHHHEEIERSIKESSNPRNELVAYTTKKQDFSSKARDGERSPTKDLRKGHRDEQSPKPFQERLDRHGNSFGDRVATKQTRIPPPPKDLVLRSDKEGTWRRSSASREPEPYSYASPPYTKQRGSRTGREQHNRGPFPQRELKEWRAKPSNVAITASQEAGPDNSNHQNPKTDLSQQDHQMGTKRPQTEEEILQDLNEATRLYLSCPDPTEAAARRQRVMIGDAKGHVEETVATMLKKPTPHANNLSSGGERQDLARGHSREQIMEELNEVTLQYLCCTDPTEAAARKQRVLTSDASCLMEKTATNILVSETTPRRPLSPWELGIKSVSPPANNSLMGLRPDQIFSPTSLTSTLREEDDCGFTPPHRRASSSRRQSPPDEARATTAQIKSIIISPSSNSVEVPQQHQIQTNPEAPEDVSIIDGQGKVKKRTIRNNKARSPLQGPSILRGASSKKRKLSQLRNSPGGGKKLKIGGSSKNQPTEDPTILTADAPNAPRNPPIQLIPAMSKKKTDFRVPPPQGP